VKFKTAELMPENEPIETVLVWDLDGPAPAACRDGRPLKISDESDRSWPPQG